MSSFETEEHVTSDDDEKSSEEVGIRIHDPWFMCMDYRARMPAQFIACSRSGPGMFSGGAGICTYIVQCCVRSFSGEGWL